MNHLGLPPMAQVAEEAGATYFPSWNNDHLPAEPVVVPAALYAELHRTTRALVRLTATMAQRLAATPGHFADLLGRSPGSAPLLPGHWLPAHREVVSARPDCIVESGRIRVLELNCHSAIGSVSTMDWMTRAYLEQTPQLWTGHRPFAARLRSLLEVGAELGAASPRVAILGTTADPDVNDGRFFSDEADYGRTHGAQVDFVDLAELDDPGLLAGYDVLLRIGMSSAWAVEAPAALAWLAENRLDRRRLPGLVVSDTADLLADKAVLAHLSIGDALTAEERAFCDRHLPWTRLLRDEVTTGPDGTRAPLVELVLAERERFVLKQCEGTQGLQVVHGASATPQEWSEQVTSMLDTGARWVVQEVAHSDPFPTRTVNPAGEVTMVRCNPVLSPALFGDHDGGVLARYAPPGGDRVVSLLNGCVLDTVLVECR